MTAIEKAEQLRRNLPMLTVNIMHALVWVSGNTEDYRAALRGHQMRWSPSEGLWFYIEPKIRQEAA